VCLSTLAVPDVVAQTLATEPMEVVVDVEPTCLLASNGGWRLDFGVYDPMSDQPREQQMDLHVRCTAGVTFHVTLSEGEHYGDGGRRMRHESADGEQALSYHLRHGGFSGPEWTETEYPASTLSTSAHTEYAYTVYGRIPAGQDVPIGRYADIVLVNVELQ